MFNDFFIHAGEVWVFAKYPCVLPEYGFVDTRTPIRMTENNYEMLEIIVEPIPVGELYRLDLNSYYRKTALVDVEITEKLEVLPEVGDGEKPSIGGGECNCEPIDISGLATKAELFSKDYNELKNKPIIPSIEGLASEEFVNQQIDSIEHPIVNLEGYAKKEEIPSIEGLVKEADLNSKLEGKVDKVDGKILVAASEVLRLSKVHNYDDNELRNRIDVLETINLETKPYIDKNGMLVLCGCPAIARGVGDEVHVTVRFFNDEEDKFVFTAEEFAKLRICMGYGAEGIGTKRNIVETSLELYDIDKVFIIDGGSQVTGEIGTVNIIAERCNYIDGIQGARAMNGGERNIVHNFNVRVKDVKLIDTLYGGGNGYSVVWNSNIQVEGETEINYLVAGGSNGYTNISRIVMENGHAKVMQGVNRGILNKAELILNGGKVDNFYLAGEPDPSVTGVQYEVYVELNGGEIVNFNKGTSGLQPFEGKIEGYIMDCIVENGDISLLNKVEKVVEDDVKLQFNENGELVVTINGISKVFIPKE